MAFVSRFWYQSLKARRRETLTCRVDIIAERRVAWGSLVVMMVVVGEGKAIIWTRSHCHFWTARRFLLHGHAAETMITEWNNAENNQTSPDFVDQKNLKMNRRSNARPWWFDIIAAWICCAINASRTVVVDEFVRNWRYFVHVQGLHRVTGTLWGKQESQSATCDGMRQERKSISKSIFLFNVHAHGWFATNDHTPKSPPNWLGNTFGY